MPISSNQHLWKQGIAVGATILFVGSLVSAIRQAPEFTKPSYLTVMTLNAAHGRATAFHQALVSRKTVKQNLQNVAECVKAIQPDVLALQEIDGPSLWSGSFDHVDFLSTATAMEHGFRGEHVNTIGLSYGTALLSRSPFTKTQSATFANSFPTPPKGIVWCRIAPWKQKPNLSICVASVHLDFARGSVRQRQVAEIADALQQIDCPLVLMGDFNCSWNSEETLHDLAASLQLHPFVPNATGGATFPTTGQRLDWIFVSSEFEFESYGPLDNESLSDHLPVVARISLRK